MHTACPRHTTLTLLSLFTLLILLSSHTTETVFAASFVRLPYPHHHEQRQRQQQARQPSLLFPLSSFSSSHLHSSLRPISLASTSSSSSSFKNTTSASQCPLVLRHDINVTSSPSFTLSHNVSKLLALLLTSVGACTATRVGTRYLLTAAHCLRDFNASGTSVDYRVLFANLSATGGSTKVVYSVDGGRVQAFRRHPKFRDPVNIAPGYAGYGRYKQYDVAWLRLVGSGKKNKRPNHNNRPGRPPNRSPFGGPPVPPPRPPRGDSSPPHRPPPHRPPGRRPFQQGRLLQHQFRWWNSGQSQAQNNISKSHSFFTTLNARADFPLPGSTVRIAGFGYYNSYSNFYDVDGDGDDGTYWSDPELYEARQVDMSVVQHERKKCEYNARYNESSQVCIGYGDEDDVYYPSDFQQHCNPCALDAGGPVFQYTSGSGIPVLLGIISVPRSSLTSCTSPYSHIRLSALFSVPGFLPPDLTARLTLVTDASPTRYHPEQTDYPANATAAYVTDEAFGHYYHDREGAKWRTATIVLGCLLGLALVALAVLAVVLWKMKKKAAAVPAPAPAADVDEGGQAATDSGQAAVAGAKGQQAADIAEQNVTPHDIIAPE